MILGEEGADGAGVCTRRWMGAGAAEGEDTERLGGGGGEGPKSMHCWMEGGFDEGRGQPPSRRGRKYLCEKYRGIQIVHIPITASAIVTAI